MSVPEIYITTAIHGVGPTPRTPAVIRGQITQFFEFKLRVPRKGYRTMDLRINLLSPELATLYAGATKLDTYSNFIYIKWRGHDVFWGPILNKEVDFEDNSIILHASDHGSRLEHHYFRIGDDVLDDPKDYTKGHLDVNAHGIHMCLIAGEWPVTLAGNAIPLGIRMGTDNHTDLATTPIKIERSQEVWRTMQDLGERTDGPLFEFSPLNPSDGNYFAICNVYGPYFRTNKSSTVKFHYNTGLKNVRNMKMNVGGEVLSHAVINTQNNHWRTLVVSNPTTHDSGFWITWESVDWDMKDKATSAEVEEALGAVGAAILDQFGRPLYQVEIVLRRDDQQQDNANQFFWLEDFKVADVVELQGVKGYETISGNYLIDEVRLEQESDNSGQVRQAMDVIPMVTTGQYEYDYLTDDVDVKEG